MGDRNTSGNRTDLLADVAEMYFLEGKIQAEIAEQIGVTRSMVSRMLTEARQRGIIEVKVHRPLRANREMADGLIKRFGLKDACVAASHYEGQERLLQLLGAAGVHLLNRYLTPSVNLGTVWGTTLRATVDAFESRNLAPINIVQLLGALGTRSDEYDGYALVKRLAQKLNGEAFYLNAPLLVESPEMVAALSATPGIREALALAQQCDIALLGIGGTDPAYCAYCLTGNITSEQLEEYVQAGAVGVVYGRFLDINGDPIDMGFYDRIIGIDIEHLLAIPIRIGVAGGPIKTRAIAGALRGGYVNMLATDSMVASEILAQD